MGDSGASLSDAPVSFNLLDEPDQTKYLEMRSSLREHDKRHERNKRLESLQDAIGQFSLRHQTNGCFLVRGFYWIGQAIGTQLRQLRGRVCKNKSSINGALSKMGDGSAESVISCIPALKGHFVEQREWTVRGRSQ
jgi:hypothetical protein